MPGRREPVITGRCGSTLRNRFPLPDVVSVYCYNGRLRFNFNSEVCMSLNRFLFVYNSSSAASSVPCYMTTGPHFWIMFDLSRPRSVRKKLLRVTKSCHVQKMCGVSSLRLQYAIYLRQTSALVSLKRRRKSDMSVIPPPQPDPTQHARK